MKSSLSLVLGLIVWSTHGQSAPLHPPTHGDWEGQVPGTWVVTRYTTHYFQTNRIDRSYLYKTLLVGEDDAGGVHVVDGECNATYEYTRTPYTSIHPPLPTLRGAEVRVETNTVSLTNGTLTLLDRVAITNTVQYGKQVYTKRMLAERPEFMVAFKSDTSDEFRGESYHMAEEEYPVGIATETRFGRKCTVYALTYRRFLNGKQIGEGTVRRSPDLPVGEFSRKTVNLAGKPIDETSLMPVAMGIDAALLATVPPPAKGPRFTERPDPESPFYQANVQLLKEQGFNDRHVQNLMPDMSSYDSLTNVYHHVQPAWIKFSAERSVENREALVKALGWTYATSHPLTEPRTEALLLEVTKTNDTVVAGRALALLAGFCAPRYMRTLEDYVIAHQFTDVQVFESIATYFHGDPVRVLHEVPFPLATLHESYLIYAPPADAVTELLRRRKENERLFNLENLLGFDDDRVRRLFSELAHERFPDGSEGKMRLVYLIEGLGIYNVPEAKTYLSKQLDDLSTPGTTNEVDQRMAMFKPMLMARTLQAALETRDPELRERVVTLLKKDPSGILMLAMGADGEGSQELLFSLRPYLADATVKSLFHSTVKTPYGELSLNSQLDRFAVLLDKRFLDDLDELVRRFLPFYDPNKDYASEARMYQKRWYIERRGIEQPPWTLASKKQPKELLAKILPSYGQAGAKVLLDMARIDDLRSEALKGLARATGDKEALLAQVQRIDRPPDPLHEANPYDIAIWVLGDKSIAEDMEQRLKYPPNHVGSRSLEYVPWLDREYLFDVTKRRDKIGILNVNRPWLITALSKYRDRQAWELIWEIWMEIPTPKNNVTFARLFNAAAGRNFGLRKSEMKAWIQTLPRSKSSPSDF